MVGNTTSLLGDDRMSEIELLQYKVDETPDSMELKRKINELVRDINHINLIVTENSLSIKLLKNDYKNLQRLLSNQ